MITLAQFEAELKNHDWYYQMSDDHSVWKKGSDNEKRILNLIPVCEDPIKAGQLFKQYQQEST